MAKVIDAMKEAYPGKLVVKDYKNGIGIFLWCEDGNTREPVFVMDKIRCNFWRHPELSKSIEAEIDDVIRFYFKRNHLFRGCKEYDDLNALTGDIVTIDTKNKEKTMQRNEKKVFIGQYRWAADRAFTLAKKDASFTQIGSATDKKDSIGVFDDLRKKRYDPEDRIVFQRHYQHRRYFINVRWIEGESFEVVIEDTLKFHINKEKTMDKAVNTLPEGLSVNADTSKVEYAVDGCVFESTILVPQMDEPIADKKEEAVEEKAKKEPNGIYVKKYYVEEDAMATGAMDDMIEVIHSAKKPTVVIEKLNDGGTRVWGTACLTRGMIEKIAKANGFYHDEIILDPYSGGWDTDWDLKKDLKESSMDDLEAHWLDWACDIVHSHYEKDKVIALCIKNKVLDIWNCPAEFFAGCYHKATSKKK